MISPSFVGSWSVLAVQPMPLVSGFLSKHSCPFELLEGMAVFRKKDAHLPHSSKHRQLGSTVECARFCLDHRAKAGFGRCSRQLIPGLLGRRLEMQ